MAATASFSTPVLIDRALLRATGAPRSDGNAVRLLLDARENYPAWLDAIRGAERYDPVRELHLRRRRGRARVRRRAGGAGARGRRACASSTTGWARAAPARCGRSCATPAREVRAFNPPRFDSPLGWLSRDHRKTIVVDGGVGFVSGLCVSAQWLGDPARRLEPWRDTGIEIRGPAVAELERAFAQVWHACGGDAAAARR